MQSNDPVHPRRARLRAACALAGVALVALAPGFAAYDPPRDNRAIQSALIALGDLDGDGDLDVAVSAEMGTSVEVLWNDGWGRLGSKTKYEIGDFYFPEMLAIGDVNGDGAMDIAVAHAEADSVVMLINQGRRDFVPSDRYIVGEYPNSFALGDVDGDGDLDLVSAHWRSNNVMVLENVDSEFVSAAEYSPGDGPVWVTLGDIDNDGDLDMVVANEKSNDLSVMRNDGRGRFALLASYPIDEGPPLAALADLDGDGDLDLLASHGTQNLLVLLNRGDGGFESPLTYEMSGWVQSFAAADVDGDGDADVVVAVGSDEGGMVTVLLNRGDANLESKLDLELTASPLEVALGDLDGDGDPDLVVSLLEEVESEHNTVLVLRNEGGAFVRWASYEIEVW